VWKILEKDVVDEILFRTGSPRDSLMLGLMARGGLRIGGAESPVPTLPIFENHIRAHHSIGGNIS
jgi:hypothetical protein